MEYTTFISLIVIFVHVTDAETIKQLIDTRPELTTLKAYCKNLNSNLYSQFFSTTNTNRYVFFAPSNEAFTRAPRELRGQLDTPTTSASDFFNRLIKYHTSEYFSIDGQPPPDILKSTDFTEKAQQISSMNLPQGLSIFYLKNSKHYYVNGARLETMDLEANNGVIHIIDNIMFPVAHAGSLFSYIEDKTNSKFSEFLSILQIYNQRAHQGDFLAVSCIRSLQFYSTVFVPSNDAFSRVPRTVLAQLKNSPEQLKKLVDSHVVCGNVYNTNLLNDTIPMAISALEGQLEVKLYGMDMYIKNNCVQGRLLPGSMTVSNGVLHVVDTVLGLRHNSLFQEIESRRDLRRFAGHVKSSATVRAELEWAGLQNTEVPADDVYTVFAPNDAALLNVDLTQLDLDNILHLHMVRGMYSMSGMSDPKIRKTTMGRNPTTNAMSPVVATTSVNLQTGRTETYVNVNHVSGKVILGDICVKNGLLHIVDSVLGTPTSETMDFLLSREGFGQFHIKLKDLGMSSDLNFKKLTIFAPNDIAFERMRQSSVGRSLLTSQNEKALKNVFMRHMVSGEGIILTDQNVPMNLRSQFDDISVKRVGSQFFVTFNSKEDVLITEPNIRTKNAVVHIIDQVMFIDDIRSSELVGASVPVKASVLLVLSGLLCILL